MPIDRIVSARIVGASALAAILLMSHDVMIRSGGAAAAPENCLAAPNGQADAAYRWYYRTDRATKRRCWYQGRVPGATAAGRPADATPAATANNPSNVSSWLSSIVSSITGASSSAPAQSAPIQQTSATPATADTRSRNNISTRSDAPRRQRLEATRATPPKPGPAKPDVTRSEPAMPRQATSPASESSSALPLDAEQRDALFRNFEQWRRRNAVCDVVGGGAGAKCGDGEKE